ncbi:MAG: DUF1566 domain-containing protein [Kangiellaceae bacterium]|nr:DUF1566 domain-containing protein [Kangiellaceae bacterium]
MQSSNSKTTIGLSTSFAIAMVLLASGCGGSSGGGDDTVEPPLINQAPVANAGDNLTVAGSENITLIGSGTDSDGTVSTFGWSQTSGSGVQLENANTASASFVSPTLTADEILVFELTVTDDDGDTGTDSVSITVEASNQPFNIAPTVSLGDDIVIQEGLEHSILATATDEDGTIESYLWMLVDGPDVELRDVTTERVTFTAPLIDGIVTMELQLEVTDDQGATATDNMVVQFENFIARLNDTGITTCGDYAVGASNQHGNRENCGDLTDGEVDPIPVGQDGHQGLDFTEPSDLNGRKGFNFTKIDQDGNELESSATEWACVKDNITGLIWEVKDSVGGLHDTTNTYSWFNTDETNHGGDIGTSNGGSCAGSDCDTEAFVNAVNEERYCGGGDWSLPTLEHLRSIADYSVIRPDLTIDTNFFPNPSVVYWSSSPEANRSIGVWVFSYLDGSDLTASKNSDRAVRLVRAAEDF